MYSVLVGGNNAKGFFDIVNSVDEFVLYDDRQFTRRDWRNRNLIKTARGLKWLTIPVKTKGRYTQRIDETEISDRDSPREQEAERSQQQGCESPRVLVHQVCLRARSTTRGSSVGQYSTVSSVRVEALSGTGSSPRAADSRLARRPGAPLGGRR